MAWRQINSRLSVSTVKTIDFDSLGDWSELWLEIVGLKHGDAATIEFGVQAGNGTLLTSTGDYSRGGATGGTAYLEFCTSISASPVVVNADLFFYNFNRTIFKSVTINGGRKNAATGASTAVGVIESILALNQLRILNSTAVDFTGGDVRLYAQIP